MSFWIVAGLMALVCAASMAAALVRHGRPGNRARADIDVYRDQLAAVERDVVRNVVEPGEADRLKTEIKRRMLEADRATVTPATDGGPTRAAAVLCVLAVVGGALGLYAVLGAPGYPDLPLEARIAMAQERAAERPGQAEAEARAVRRPAPEASADFATLMERLRAAVAARPDDLKGHELLALNEARMGNFSAASRAQARVLEIKGEEAEAADFADHADLLILAADGYVSPEAEAVLAEALARDPRNGTARYYTGLMYMQTGRPDLGFQTWERLLAESNPDAPWVPPIRAQIEVAAAAAGVEYRLPDVSAEPGPTAADVEAASEMGEADRAAMIEGMVQQLSDRLAQEGGPPADWARLIRAYGVLGRTDAAAAIWAEAQGVFTEADRAEIRDAARAAGVAQ